MYYYAKTYFVKVYGPIEMLQKHEPKPSSRILLETENANVTKRINDKWPCAYELKPAQTEMFLTEIFCFDHFGT